MAEVQHEEMMLANKLRVLAKRKEEMQDQGKSVVEGMLIRQYI